MLLALLACTPQPDSASPSVETAAPAAFQVGQEVKCSAPVPGWDRFADEAAARGVVGELPHIWEIFGTDLPGVGGALVLEDLDGDGDLDLLIGSLSGRPDAYDNDGTGHFTRREVTLAGSYGAPALLAMDLDGDALPELVAPAFGQVRWYRNLGGFRWALGGDILQPDAAFYQTATAGDVDGDGDLDLVTPASNGPDWVVVREGTTWTPTQALWVDGEPSRTQVGSFTDRDFDGDMDLFLPADQGPRSAFWRNDGGPLEDDAPAIGADLAIAAMGLDSADLNGDGDLDYCLSDVGPVRCLLSDGHGAFFQQAPLPVDEPLEAMQTIGWSVDLADLDNDGLLELFQASGPDPGAWSAGLLFWSDLLYSDFQDITAEAGLADLANHITAATGDVDGDGALDLVVAGPGHAPHVYMNGCTDGRWLSLDFAGAPENPQAIGVRVQANGLVRELMSLRDKAQGPSRIHLGLGDALDVEVTVTFPDGVVVSETLPTNRHVLVVHPRSQALPVPWTGERAPELTLQDGEQRVVGRVVDGLTGEPVISTVRVDGDVLQVDKGGGFSLVATGPFELRVTRPESIPNRIPVDPAWQRYPGAGVVGRLFPTSQESALLADGGALLVAAHGPDSLAAVLDVDHGPVQPLTLTAGADDQTSVTTQALLFTQVQPGPARVVVSGCPTIEVTVTATEVTTAWVQCDGGG